MPRLIYTGSEGLTGVNKDTTGLFVNCAGRSYSKEQQKLIEEGSIKTIDAYTLCNNPTWDEDDVNLIAVFNAVKDSVKDIVFHDDFGKYRARELAGAISVFLGEPVYKVYPSGEVVRIIESLLNINEFIVRRLAKLLKNGRISIPDNFKPMKVVICNTAEQLENYSIEKLNDDGSTTFLRAGYYSLEEAKNACDLYNLEVAFTSIVPNEEVKDGI